MYVQESLRQVGVRMEMRLLEDASMWEKLKSGDFEALFIIVQAGPWAQLRDFGRGNHTGYYNPEAFEVIDRIWATADPEAQDRLYGRLTEIFRTDLPVTRLIPMSRDWFVHRRIRGLSTPFRADPDRYMEDLWVEDESQP